MPGASAGIAPPALAAAEGRVDENDSGRHRERQVVMNIFGVVARDLAGQCVGEQRRADRIAFVEDKRGACGSGVRREHARARTWLEDVIGSVDRCGMRGKPRKRQRRAELLHVDLMLGAIGLGRKRLLEGQERRECLFWGARRTAHLRARHPKRLRRFKRIISVAHRPVAVGIGTTKAFGHQTGEQRPGDRARSGDARQQRRCDIVEMIGARARGATVLGEI